jgi:hypothetical protein
MTILKTLAAAALLSALTATPVFAQAAIQEPGVFAFYHPNLDVLNGGAPTPAARTDPREQWRFTSDPYRAFDPYHALRQVRPRHAR